MISFTEGQMLWAGGAAMLALCDILESKDEQSITVEDLRKHARLSLAIGQYKEDNRDKGVDR